MGVLESLELNPIWMGVLKSRLAAFVEGKENEEEGGRVENVPVRFSSLAVKTAVTHTVTYFVAGILAYNLMDYAKSFSEPPLSYLMRPTSDPMVMLGPLFQPVRGILFALAIYPLRSVLFGRRWGWLILWWLLVSIGILSTFGPAPGSVEGLLYTIIPPLSQLLGLWETVLQALLLSIILCYWVNNPRKWLGWTLGIVFLIMMLMLLAGVFLARP